MYHVHAYSISEQLLCCYLNGGVSCATRAQKANWSSSVKWKAYEIQLSSAYLLAKVQRYDSGSACGAGGQGHGKHGFFPVATQGRSRSLTKSYMA